MTIRISVEKEAGAEELKKGTYFLNFDVHMENYLFVNFPTLEELHAFVKKRGMVSLYNEWLDFVASDFIADTAEKYSIGRIVDVTENRYKIEVIEDQMASSGN